MGKVHVIGAGPAGSIAAISAVRSGHDVSLYEEHPSAGIPSKCSGLISKEGLEFLKEFVDYKKHAITAMQGAIIDFAGFRLKVDSGRDIAYLIDRASFDAELALKAEREGARVFYSRRAEKPFPEGTIIGADGANSTVASSFLFPAIGKFVGTAKAQVKYGGQMPEFARVFLSNSMFPGFFGWLIPQNEEEAEIGAGCALPGNPNRALESLSRYSGIALPQERRHSIIPVAQRPLTAARIRKRNVLLAGDAAGQVKSTTGGGVVFGTKCALLAGRNADFPGIYEKEWRERYGPDLDAHQRIRLSLSGLNDDSLRAIGSLASALKMERFLGEKGSMDSPMSMLCPELFLHPFRALLKNSN
ncbi:MAG: NAD(P)/FAD-dependent oxidoreductase [Candidatus Bilamarchaeaceae archaeon]